MLIVSSLLAAVIIILISFLVTLFFSKKYVYFVSPLAYGRLICFRVRRVHHVLQKSQRESRWRLRRTNFHYNNFSHTLSSYPP